MDYNEILNTLEQYRNNGGNLNEFGNYLNALASNGKTPLGLNQWQRSDKPVMDDFNEDNRIIDENIRGLRAGIADLKLTKTIKVSPAAGFEVASHGGVGSQINGYALATSQWFSKTDGGDIAQSTHLGTFDFVSAGISVSSVRTLYADLADGNGNPIQRNARVFIYKDGRIVLHLASSISGIKRVFIDGTVML